MKNSVITAEHPSQSGDLTDKWQRFFEDYTAGDSVHRWHLWCLLTTQEQQHLVNRFALEPPPPAREKKVRRRV